jgi:CRP/FNR family transcriptional regulator, cAMP and macrophage regulator
MNDLPIRHAAWIARCLGRGELAPLGSGDIDALAGELGEARHAGGTTVFRMGDLPGRVYIVRRGAIELTRELHGRRVTLQLLHPGDVFGDIPLIARMPLPFDARAIEDSVVLSIDSVTLWRILEQRPRLAHRWMVSIALRMAKIQARLVDLLAGGLQAQLAALLVREAEQGQVRLSQQVLAALVGGRRTSVNRVLKDLEARELIKLRYRHVEILDPAGLAALAGAVATPGLSPAA